MKKLSRKVFGTAAALALLPFWAVVWILHGVVVALRDFREFAGEFVKSFADPDHVPPIGLKGFYTLKECRQKAYQAEAEYDNEEAAKNWEKCAFYYDTEAMLRVGAHYESSWDDEDEESSQKLASEWYAVAASFGSAEGESGYSRITSVFLTDDEKKWLRRNYIRSRKHCLRD